MPKLDQLHLSGTVSFSIPADPATGDVWLECRKTPLDNGKHHWVLHAHVYDGQNWMWLRLYGEIYNLTFELKERWLQQRNRYKQLMKQRSGLPVVRYSQPNTARGTVMEGFAFERQVEYLPLTCTLIRTA